MKIFGETKIKNWFLIGIIITAIIVFLIFIAIFCQTLPYVELTADSEFEIERGISFDAEIKYTSGPYVYTFDFGDGTPGYVETMDSSSIIVNHTYIMEGTYTITVTVHDNYNDMYMDRETIHIVDMPDYVNMGDFLYIDFKNKDIESGRMNDHIAVYIGDNSFIHVSEEGEVEAVKYSYFNTQSFDSRCFGYVPNIAGYQIDAVVDWLEEKIGEDGLSPTELIINAYNSQGIKINDNTNGDVNIQDIIDYNDTEIRVDPIFKVPSFVERGDIVLMDGRLDAFQGVEFWLRPGFSNDHGALYLGHDYRNGNYFIHASSNGVDNVTLQEFSVWAENFTYWDVNKADANMKNGAIEFAKDQLMKEYQYFFGNLKHQDTKENLELGTKDNNPYGSKETSDRWYCMELIWASYYNCNGIIGSGIDIDRNAWGELIPDLPRVPEKAQDFWYRYSVYLPLNFSYVTGYDIQKSTNITRLVEPSVDFEVDTPVQEGNPLRFNLSINVSRNTTYEYVIYFGDNTSIKNESTENKLSVNHTYGLAGNYTVLLSVVDSYDNVITDGQIIHILQSDEK